MLKKKILFITGTRADYGKIKSIMRILNLSVEFDVYIFVTGMHLIEKFGQTYLEIQKDNLGQIFLNDDYDENLSMDRSLANIILSLSKYVQKNTPDMIVVHGDRLDALAGAIVGACNNIIISHIEGGETSGTLDESIRHSISKFSHLHFVANNDAKKRIMQLGENEQNIHVIGSPDIDIMLNENLPSLEDAKKHYEINFNEYSILLYHSVVTDLKNTPKFSKTLVDALIESKKNYLVVYPNNDEGHNFILEEYKRLEGNKQFRLIPSIRFEFFLTLLKNAQFIIGNSSTGVRESCVYGTMSIDIGNRQHNRYNKAQMDSIYHVEHDKEEILKTISMYDKYKKNSNMYFGFGNSAERFYESLKTQTIWETSIQKVFVDVDF